MRAYRKSRRMKEVAAFCRDVGNERNSDHHIRALCHRMLQQVGGPEKMAKLWKEHMDAARARRPGGQVALQCFKTMFRLMDICNQR